MVGGATTQEEMQAILDRCNMHDLTAYVQGHQYDLFEHIFDIEDVDSILSLAVAHDCKLDDDHAATKEIIKLAYRYYKINDPLFTEDYMNLLLKLNNCVIIEIILQFDNSESNHDFLNYFLFQQFCPNRDGDCEYLSPYFLDDISQILIDSIVYIIALCFVKYNEHPTDSDTIDNITNTFDNLFDDDERYLTMMLSIHFDQREDILVKLKNTTEDIFAHVEMVNDTRKNTIDIITHMRSIILSFCKISLHDHHFTYGSNDDHDNPEFVSMVNDNPGRYERMEEIFSNLNTQYTQGTSTITLSERMIEIDNSKRRIHARKIIGSSGSCGSGGTTPVIHDDSDSRKNKKQRRSVDETDYRK